MVPIIGGVLIDRWSSEMDQIASLPIPGFFPVVGRNADGRDDLDLEAEAVFQGNQKIK